jgi:quercetin dioxygenase-like cupin family protein
VQGAICGFVQLAPGASFPRHAHAGEERTLVLAGTLVSDDGRTVHAGEELVMAEGSAHTVAAAPDAALAYLVVTRVGILFDGEDAVAGPDDPRT